MKRKDKTYTEWASEFIRNEHMSGADFKASDVYLKMGILLALAGIADEIRTLTEILGPSLGYTKTVRKEHFPDEAES